MKRLRPWIKIFTPHNLETIKHLEDGHKVVLAALISEIKLKTTKTGEKMALLKLEDEISYATALIFPDLYRQKLNLIYEGNLLWFKTELDKDEEGLSLLIEDLTKIEDLQFFKDYKLILFLSPHLVNEEFLEYLRSFLTFEERQTLPLSLGLRYPDAQVYFELNGARINPSYETLSLLLVNFKDLEISLTS